MKNRYGASLLACLLCACLAGKAQTLGDLILADGNSPILHLGTPKGQKRHCDPAEVPNLPKSIQSEVLRRTRRLKVLFEDGAHSKANVGEADARDLSRLNP